MFAHQLSTWLVDVQDLRVLGGDPLSRGWDLLGAGGARADEAVLSPGVTAWLQLGLLVAALGLGLVAGWDRLASRLGPTVLQAGWVMAAWTAGAGALCLWLLLGA